MVHKAVVKNVLSGDTVILRGNPRPNGPPPERLLALSNVQAPRLGNTTRPDEPFGFYSREFLRKLVVGKEVSFVPEYTVPTTQREYGSLFLANGDNVAELAVKSGWLKVRESGKALSEQEEEVMERLLDLQREAQDAKIGIWSDDQEKGTRQVSFTFEKDGHAFLNKYKGKPLDAVIEQVRDGSTFRVLLILPDQTQQFITLHLSGIKAPNCKRDNADDTAVSEPFGEECKFFVESRLLQRGVKVILEGLAQSGGQSFVGSVQHPAGNIAELLLSQGFAKCVDWSITLATSGPTVLRNAEKSAKEKRLRVWRGFVPTTTCNKNTSEFDATVVRIVTGDTLIVKPKNGPERKVQLASVKQAPRGVGTTAPTSKSRDMKEVGYQFEAREFLRKKLIGKNVHVTIDYHKPAQEGYEARDCATVMVGHHNIAEQLIAHGFATVIRHRKDDDNRSHYYDQLLLAEKKAEEGKVGVHSTKELPVVRIVDASENLTKSRQFLTFLKRSGKKIHAVVEHVANGSRLFVWVPKENCRLSFVLSGVRAPRVGRTSNDKSEPYGQEALEFVSQKCLQHDVEIEVENVDKVGSFVGSMFVNGENLAVALLSQGFGYIHEYSANDSHYANQLYNAELEARNEKRGLWADYSEEKEDVDKQQTSGPNREYIDIVVSDIVSGSHFYVQKITDEIPQLEKLMTDLGQYQNSRPADPAFKPRVGENVSAKFTEDDCWYRARVRRISHEGIEVLYIDYGNSETLPSHRIRALPETFKQLKAQAQEAVLSFVQSPTRDEDYGIEAVERFRDLTANKQLVANIDARENGVLCLTVYDFNKSTSAEESINLDMVRDGQAFVTPKVRYARGNETIVKALQNAQEEAIRRRCGMFEYGDITGNDDITDSRYY
ncbi:uncharacterized protein BX663DRAFT_515989 [Cokeromyces recurvatus]|uniref:uncharacterized protein n=1 Tax=Cokeromyces recurvatus TaxID=90255 RepID=UPI00221E84E9|nr:uncharacterized protein BX663DRAFT_515989 [Cokeromyces recurvatus]KAI7901007.1 hypothetical protein BX663DRAFT_515989 [Cokeromyces recurvatus]